MDWKRLSELTEKIKKSAEESTLDEFLDEWGPWFFPFWDRFNKMPDHDEQLLGEDDEQSYK